MSPLEARLLEALADTPLAAHAEATLAPLVERRRKDACAATLEGPALRGLARAAAAGPDAARFLASRPQLFADLATLRAGDLARRTARLPERPLQPAGAGLEDVLDAIRLLRRDETLVAACSLFGGMADLPEVSLHLSILAETCVRHALATAEGDGPRSGLAVVGLGKIAGREFTFGSDLDLIFLYDDALADVERSSRTGQRLISYLSTMTGAGVAYAVDARLRPSGRQGTLVSTLQAYERYQTQQAALWEHLALMRARAIAGEVAPAQRVLERTRATVLAEPRSPWRAVAEMRDRVASERSDGVDRSAAAERLHFKTGVGGLMDTEFLATGALLERGAHLPAGTLPSIPAMLRAVDGEAVEALLARHAFLRRVEACARWAAGRAVESLAASGESLAVVADLVDPGLGPEALLARLRETFSENRRAFRTVVDAGSIEALRTA